MIISICGKGGSGKSTILTLLAGGFKRNGKKVIILDSDESNSSLYWMLGFDHPPQPLMNLVGGKKNIQKKLRAKSSGSSNESETTIWEMKKIPSAQIPPAFMVENNDYKLVTTGKINQSLEGCACPLGIVTREFLGKLDLSADEVALVDMEAGVEHFGRGIETSVDKVICIVEPSLESISLAAKIKGLSQSAGAHFQGAILNKIVNSDQQTIVANKLKELDVPIIGTLGQNSQIQSACLEGKTLEFQMASEEIDNIVSVILK